MKILHIVTLITPDNAYGGPVRVALNQVRSLRNSGHHVDLIAGSYGFDKIPEAIDGVQLQLFRAIPLVPGTGFAGLCSPGMLAHLVRRADTYDVVHIHLARDLITLPSAVIVRAKGIPYVLQTHGMIDESKKRLAGVIDWALTRRIVAGAGLTFYLTPNEKRSVQNLFPSVRQAHLPNGVPIPPEAITRDGSEVLEILYLARLHERKRPLEFVCAAQEIVRDNSNLKFALVGPDAGEGQRLSSYIESNGLQNLVRWEGPIPIEATLSRMRQAAIYVLPSVNEPFPMSVLEAMSLGLPVVITRSNGLAAVLEAYSAGIVVEDDIESLVQALRALIEYPPYRAMLGTNARKLILERFSIEVVVRELTTHYDRLR